MEILSLPTCDEFPVRADIHAAPGDRVVILCHGFKGHRRWGFIPRLAHALREAGITAIAMDFSLNGRLAPGSAEPQTDDAGFPAPEAFRRNTVARECDDLRRVVAWVRGGGDGRFPPGVAPGLWGHSRGGVVATLVALDDDAIPALVTWSTPAHPDFYTGAQKARWRESGAVEFTDTESKTPLAIDVGYLDDLEAHALEYDLAARAPGLAAPHLVVHGEQDMVIPVAEAARLVARPEAAGADKRLLRLATGHTFGYEGRGEALERATRETVEWFDRYLSPRESS